MPLDPLILRKIGEEQSQSHVTRIPLYKKLSRLLNKPVVAYASTFDSFLSRFPGALVEDVDAKELEGVLQRLDTSKGFVLLISSPGGFPLAAERIVNVCRSYGNGQFDALVPAQAKSAATMICFGAQKVFMGATSELGPVDPQIPHQNFYLPAHTVVKTYDDLFSQSVSTSGRLEPYLQQLQNYDAAVIESYRDAIELSKSISIKHLKTGMMTDCDETTIESRISVFLSPEQTRSHGRPINGHDARACGIKVEEVDVRSETWKTVYELYARLDNFVSRSALKTIESTDHAVAWPVPPMADPSS